MNSEPTMEQSAANTQRLVPIKMGEAIVYIQASSIAPMIEPTDAIYTVSLPSPQEAFESAMGAIKECVGVMGAQLHKLQRESRPNELSVEFAVQLEAVGKIGIIPVLFSSETKAGASLKVTAKWVLEAQ